MPWRHQMKSIAWRLVRRSRLGPYVDHNYDYSFAPAQMAFLVDTVDRTTSVPGNIVEVGCAYGATTVFLNKHLEWSGIQKQYFAVDTFAGFTADDVAVEREYRGKADAYERYTDVTLPLFEKTLKQNGVSSVLPIRADVNSFDFNRVAPIAFCLLDVDLYRPMRRALDEIYDRLSPGGIIVVDDCQKHDLWDGALQAYTEFTAARGLPMRVALRQFGLVEKPG